MVSIPPVKKTHPFNRSNDKFSCTAVRGCARSVQASEALALAKDASLAIRQPGNSVVNTSRTKGKISMKHGETCDFKHA